MLDASIITVIEAGRALLVPATQRAAALRYAWARHQTARGLRVWRTPEILTWDSWLAMQWRGAALRNLAPHRQLLNASQERLLWEAALRELGDDHSLLLPHASALMRAAAEANQSLLSLARMAVTDEEQLLVAATQAVQRQCEQRGVVALSLLTPEQLGFLAHVPAPRLAGLQQLTPLQQRVQELYWPGEALLLQPGGDCSTPELRRTMHLEAEIAACAQWCREHLSADGARRLLVVSAWQEPDAHTQGEMLWRSLAGSTSATEGQRQLWLAVEGGDALHHHSLVNDALAALSLGGEWIETAVLLQLLGSAYFSLGTTAENCALQAQFGAWGLARWRMAALAQALASVNLPAARRLLTWLQELRAQLSGNTSQPATFWAGSFTRCLEGAGFAVGGSLDSSDAQRLARWGELLDEFAALDATLAPMDAQDAVQTLRGLAQQSVHQVATGDAAITLTTRLHDPLVRYDGIWVMGLTESRWPSAPRPDPYVPLMAQRRCNWPQAGVTQRLQAARWLQQRWQQCTSELVLSYARHEGDVVHRPSALLNIAGTSWQDAAPAAATGARAAVQTTEDAALPALAAAELAGPLRGGARRLLLQQQCAFRAQAEWRLGASQPPVFTDGIGTVQRGILLHSLLEGLWRELADHAGLMALTAESQRALFERHWKAAVQANAARGLGWLAPDVLQRERRRAARLVERLLELDRAREPFAASRLEHEVPWHCGEVSVQLRIDRIDQCSGGQIVVDYKSGAAESVRLQEGEARPLQLALYVLALQQAGIEAQGALLLSLKPANLGYAGASAVGPELRGVRPVSDWPTAAESWQRELVALVAAHLAGDASLATRAVVCEHCHLHAFCRRRTTGDASPEDEASDE